MFCPAKNAIDSTAIRVTILYPSLMLNFFPSTSAAFSSVFNVAEIFSESSRRSTAVRLVRIRVRKIAVQKQICLAYWCIIFQTFMKISQKKVFFYDS